MTASLVSCITIFWNAERFLREAVESALSQTYSHCELILVDDGSTDRSRVIARGFADRHPGRIRLVAHPDRRNLGMSASRNLGLRHASGEFVAFLDADDVWLPFALEEQVAIMQRHREAAMVYGPLSWWHSWTGSRKDQDRDYVESLGVPPDSLIPPPRLLPLFLQDRAAVPSGMLVRRAVIDQVAAFEDAFEGEYEDQVFCAKVCLDYPVFASSRTWYRYRQHDDSAVSVGLKTGATLQARVVFLAWLERYLEQQGVRDAAVLGALRGELRRARHPRRHQAVTRLRGLADRVHDRLGVRAEQTG